MPKVTFILPGGEERTIEAQVGQSVMRVAVSHMVPGIIGECGGGMVCATCHIKVAETWAKRIGSPGRLEDEMLDLTELERGPTSRLGCQITMTAETDGLAVYVPGT